MIPALIWRIRRGIGIKDLDALLMIVQPPQEEYVAKVKSVMRRIAPTE